MTQAIKLLASLLFVPGLVDAQIDAYDYAREINGISQQWHKITLPDDIFGKTIQQLFDIRIFGITAAKDTVEAPYLLQFSSEQLTTKEIPYKILNVSNNEAGHYFTLEVSGDFPVNQIDLKLLQRNFDWKIDLEGSNDRNEWFSILADYRILSIKNAFTDFHFTKLVIPSSNYRLYRILVQSNEKPELAGVSIQQKQVTDGKLKSYPVNRFTITEKDGLTKIDFTLTAPVRASQIEINASDKFDYYRNITISYLVDSVKAADGWRLIDAVLARGTLNSLEKNSFPFDATTIQKGSILIDNQANQPLSIESVTLRGYEYQLLARFTSEGRYFLTYGNRRATQPTYDIVHFFDKIPPTASPVELGAEVRIEKRGTPTVVPLFEREAWLWALLIAIIVLLGWFSIKMIREN